MRESPALIQEEVLTYQQDDSTVEVLVGSAPWYAWLETASTFTVHSGQGHFTVRKERAGNQRGAPVWRAYQKRAAQTLRPCCASWHSFWRACAEASENW